MRPSLVLAGWGASLMLLALLGAVAFGFGTLPAVLLVSAGTLAVLWGAVAGRAPAAESGVAGASDDPVAEPGRSAARESVASIGLAAAVPLILTGLIGVGAIFAAVGAALLVISLYLLSGEDPG